MVSLSCHTKSFLTGNTEFDDMAIANQMAAKAEEDATTCSSRQKYLCSVVAHPVISLGFAAETYPKKCKPWAQGGREEICDSLGLLVAYGVVYVVSNDDSLRNQYYVVVRSQADAAWSAETTARIDEVVTVTTGKPLKSILSTCNSNVRTFKKTDAALG